MENIPISKFKATCTAIIERVHTSREPIVITKRGKPVAEIVPHAPAASTKKRLGYMAGTARILGDLVDFSDEELRTLEQTLPPPPNTPDAAS